MIDDRDAPDNTLPRLAKLPMLSTEAQEPMLPIDSTEPTDPMESTDPVEAIERKESREAKLQREGMCRVWLGLHGWAIGMMA